MDEVGQVVVAVRREGEGEALDIMTGMSLTFRPRCRSRVRHLHTLRSIALCADSSQEDLTDLGPPDNQSMRGWNSPRGRGRGRGGPFLEPASDYSSPRGGASTPRGRGRGRGEPDDNPRGRGGYTRGGRGLTSKLKAGIPLSRVLYEDRPLLKPITFVRSVHTATLFQAEEDILKPIGETVGMLAFIAYFESQCQFTFSCL